MHVRREAPLMAEEDFVDAAGKLWYTLIRYGIPVLLFAGAAQLAEQLIRNFYITPRTS